MDRRHTWWGLWGLALTGCAALHTPVVQSTSTSDLYESATLTYDRVLEPVSTGSAEAATTVASCPRERLIVRSPHPDGRPDWAQVSLVVISPPQPEVEAEPATGWKGRLLGWTHQADRRLPGIQWGKRVEEAWLCDVPRTDIDALLIRLERAGYFSPASTTSGSGLLTVDLDGRRVRKPWPVSSELATLSDRARMEGQLASFVPAEDTELEAALWPGAPAMPRIGSPGTLAAAGRPGQPLRALATADSSERLRRLPPIERQFPAALVAEDTVHRDAAVQPVSYQAP